MEETETARNGKRMRQRSFKCKADGASSSFARINCSDQAEAVTFLKEEEL